MLTTIEKVNEIEASMKMIKKEYKSLDIDNFLKNYAVKIDTIYDLLLQIGGI